MDALRGPGFLGTGANLLADITLIVEILFFLVLCAGVAAQLSKAYAWHARLQIPVVLLNLAFIVFVMLPSFLGVAGQLPTGLSRPPVWVSLVHGLLGLTAQGLAIYCLLAGTAILPRKFGVLRYWMRATFALWTITVLFGIGVYLTWYTGQASAGPVAAEHNADLAAEHAEESVAIAPAGPTPTTAGVVSEHAEEAITAEPTEAPPPTLPATEPAGTAAAPVETPTQGEPTVTALAQAAGPAGWLRFSDDQVHNDRVTLQLAGLALPANGGVYQAWLQGEEGAPVSLGVLNVSGGAVNYAYTDPAGRDLTDLFSRVFITLEPAGDSDPAPSSQVVYSGQLPAAAIGPVRGLVSSTRQGTAFAAWNRAGRVVQLAEAQQEYAAANDLTNLRVHAENALNIIEGAQGPNYGDLDSDGVVTTDDPADPGLLSYNNWPGYLELAPSQAAQLAQSPGLAPEAAAYVSQVASAADGARQWAEQVRDLELEIIQARDTAAAAGAVARLGQLAQALFAGLDANGDGQVAPVPGEAGTKTMYEQAQGLAGIALTAVATGPGTAPAAPPTAELVGEHAEEVAPTATLAPPTVAPVPPTATAAPPPTSTPAPTPTPTIELISEHDGG